jgi:hypothetical protein
MKMEEIERRLVTEIEMLQFVVCAVSRNERREQ